MRWEGRGMWDVGKTGKEHTGFGWEILTEIDGSVDLDVDRKIIQY
jgi:hypothetical protein